VSNAQGEPSSCGRTRGGSAGAGENDDDSGDVADGDGYVAAGGVGGDVSGGDGGDAAGANEGDAGGGDGGGSARGTCHGPACGDHSGAAAGNCGGAADCDGHNGSGGGGAGLGDGMEEGAAAESAFDPAKDLSEEVKLELLALMEATREEIHEEQAPGRKRRRLEAGSSTERRFTYATTSTAIRALYENYGDWDRAEAAVQRRKGHRPGRFNSFRLRAVQRFALKSGGAGLSLKWLEELFDLLDTWDGSKPGMPIDDLHEQPIRQAFKSRNAFKDAVRDDVDDAVLDAGWMKCTLVLDGERFEALFRPVLRVILDMLKAGTKVQLWSGDNGPALPTDKRESPLDGDAFRLNEAAVMADKKDPSCFVLGLHVYSDASQLSWSGGMFLFARVAVERGAFSRCASAR